MLDYVMWKTWVNIYCVPRWLAESGSGDGDDGHFHFQFCLCLNNLFIPIEMAVVGAFAHTTRIVGSM